MSEENHNSYVEIQNMFEKLVSEHENERKKRLNVVILIFFCFVCLVSAFLYVINAYFYSGEFILNKVSLQFIFLFVIPVILLLICLCIFVINRYNKNFKLYLKKACLQKVLTRLGSIKWQIGKSIITKTQRTKSMLLPDYHYFKNDDTFTGEYKGVVYSIAETELFYRRRQTTEDTKIYHGVLINFAANKKIKAKTIVTSKGDMNIMNNAPLLGAIIALSVFVISAGPYAILMIIAILFGLSIAFAVLSLFHKEPFEKLNKIVLEDPVFNRKYTAYSSDEVEGRYLLTTGFMERFNKVRTAFGVNNIKCSFYDNDFMIAIKTRKDLFELGSLFTSLKNPKYIRKFMDEYISIISLIDYFKLDEKTGL